MSTEAACPRPHHRNHLKLTQRDQSVTLRSATYRRGGGESTQ
jgi:hypothetical protein